MTRRLSDIVCIFMIHLARLRREAGPFLLASVVFPVGMYLFATAVATQADTASEGSKRHFLAASMVFSLSLTGISWLGYLMLENRFMGRTKLFATLPLEPSSYVAGLMVLAVVQGLFGMVSLLAAGKVLGVSISVSAGSALLMLLIMMAALSIFSGVSVVVASRARSFSEGSLLTDALGAGLVLMAPVYYPAAALPAVLRWIGVVLPTTYVANALEKLLAGSTGVGAELSLLVVVAVAVLLAGLWTLRWREN